MQLLLSGRVFISRRQKKCVQGGLEAHMDIGVNIKAIRVSANLTQEQLADKLFISRSTLSGYENGNRIDLGMVMKICSVLQTDPNHLFGVEDKSVSKDEFMKAVIKAAEEMYEELFR